MRILQLGDTHLGIARRAWRAPPGWSRADDHLAALGAALSPERLARVDLVVHTGDVFDRSRPPAPAVARARALLAAVARQVPVVVLAGNHDRRGLLPSLGAGGGGLAVVDRPTRLRVAGLVVALVPHARQAADWAAAAATVATDRVDLLVTHQAVAGVQVPGFTFRVGTPAETLGPQHLPPGAPVVLSGHLHPHQALRCGGVPVVYAGSTERTSFSEEGQAKGVVVWDLAARSWRFEALPTRPMVRVREEDELHRVVPGAYVGVPPRRLRALAQAVADRGGIVALPPKAPPTDRRQLRLFAA